MDHRTAQELLNILRTGSLAQLRSFKTEQEAMTFAKRVAQLKPGDEIWMCAKGGTPERTIFMGFTDDGGANCLAYYDCCNDTDFEHPHTVMVREITIVGLIFSDELEK